MTEATATETALIMRDLAVTLPVGTHKCPICGLEWENEDLSDACCIPGVLAYAAGRKDGWTTREVPERTCGNVAYIEDLPLLLKYMDRYIDHNILPSNNKQGYYDGIFARAWMVKIHPDTFVHIEQGEVVWISETAYRILVDAFGDPVPGLVYWPAELSCPVGRDEYA